MYYFFVILILAFDFWISWSNASYCGRYWSESKATGGSFRAYVVSGYIMAIAGFTMVYGYILILILPYFLMAFTKVQFEMADFQMLSADLLYVMVALAVIPTGFIIWFRSVANAWKQRTFGNIATAAWNSYAQIHNTVTAVREMPSALGRISKAMLGGKKKKKGNEYIVILAILAVIVALLGGYFTASAIMKKADREYDELPQMPEYQNS